MVRKRSENGAVVSPPTPDLAEPTRGELASAGARPSRRRDGEATRQRVLDAAVASIVEIGYYQSSSNAIARRAGVTWGVLQHQFGTREALLLEVLNDRWGQLHATVAGAEVQGATLELRLREVLDVLAQHYGHLEQLVTMQIGLDLLSNPEASVETRRAVQQHADRLRDAWQLLCERALGESAGEADLASYAFAALRGYLIGDIIGSTFSSHGDDEHQRDLLVQGVAASIRIELAQRGIV